MTSKRCASCGALFFADADWKRECLSCWKKQKFWESERGAELLDLRARVAWLKAERSSTVGSPSWLVSNRRWLLQKLHPDKHNGSDIATQITRELLKLHGESNG